PSLLAAQASARVSSILLANSGGVNTSSLERFAMQVSTSGLRARSANPACSRTGQILQRERRVALGRREDLVLAEVGEERVLTEGRHLRERVEPEVTPLKFALTQVAPLCEGDRLPRAREHG